MSLDEWFTRKKMLTGVAGAAFLAALGLAGCDGSDVVPVTSTDTTVSASVAPDITVVAYVETTPTTEAPKTHHSKVTTEVSVTTTTTEAVVGKAGARGPT